MSAEQDLANANVQIANLISEVTRFRDAAMGFNAIYPTITEGRQAVADGKYFSVPGSGAYMRLYRRQGSSAELIAEFPDRAQVQGIVDLFGGRGVVGGSGDLIAQGFAGLGGPVSYSSSDDFFTVPQGGVCNNSTSNVPANPPVPGLVRFGGMKFGGTNAELLLLASGTSVAREIYANVKTSAGWETEYRRMLSDRDILGTVSQSGGVPTGAIIERGNNANGNYVKFADGTVLARTIAVATYTDSARLSFAWSFPVSLTASDDYSWSACMQQRNPLNTAEGIPRSKIQVSQVTESSHSSNTLGLEVLASAGTFSPGDFVWLSIRVEGRWY